MGLEKIRWLRYFLKTPATYPIYLIFFVTSQCMGKCRHCFYWQDLNKEESPLSVEEIKKTAKSIGPLLQITFTGGEPLLREDLAEVIRTFYLYNRPFNLALATSGFFPESLIVLAESVLKNCSESYFTVGLPIEGAEELNDYIRGVAGSFKHARDSIRGLKELKKHFPRLIVLIDLTVSSFNQDYLTETYHMIRDDFAVDVINFIITRGKPREPEALDISPEKIEDLLKLIDNDLKYKIIPGYKFYPRLLKSKDQILRRAAFEIYKGNRVSYHCRAGDLAGVIYPEGEVFPCELWDEPIGLLREVDYDLCRLWRSKQAKKIRKQIKDKKCQCYHQCFLSPSLFFDMRNLSKILFKTISFIRI
jgi:MoaA/NifB/PqqE/SkfB family radical SAM enzyme